MTSWLRDRKEKKAAEQAQQQYDLALGRWTDRRQYVEDMIYLAEHIEKLQDQMLEEGVSVRLKDGENMIVSIEEGGLVEPRVTGSHYEGRSKGVSIRVMKRVSYRVGSHAGTFVRGDEKQTIIDTGGTITITDQRMLYTSPNRNREWAWGKLVDIRHDSAATYMSVTNRQKTSGIVYGAAFAQTIQDRITLALALHDGEVEHLVTDLREQMRELDQAKPTPPLPSP